MAPFKNPLKAKRKPDEAADIAREVSDQGTETDEDLLARYEIYSEIGRGAFARVHRAHLKGKEQGREVAMRICPIQYTYNETMRSRDQLKVVMEKALAIQEELQGRNIVRLYDYIITDSDLIIFTELCNGGDLFDKILNAPDGHFGEDEARGVARSLMRAIEICHDLGYLHRDIKPENIMYSKAEDKPEDLILCDFGCCLYNAKPSDTFEGVVGTPGYLAPEMLRGEPYSMLCDEWLLDESLTGRCPIVGETPSEMAEATLRKNVPYPNCYWGGYTTDCRDFVSCLLHHDPKQRLKASEALKHPWLSQSADVLSSDAALRERDSVPPENTVALVTRKTTKLDRVQANVLASLMSGAGNIPDIVTYDTIAIMQGRATIEDMSRLRLESGP